MLRQAPCCSASASSGANPARRNLVQRGVREVTRIARPEPGWMLDPAADHDVGTAEPRGQRDRRLQHRLLAAGPLRPVGRKHVEAERADLQTCRPRSRNGARVVQHAIADELLGGAYRHAPDAQLDGQVEGHGACVKSQSHRTSVNSSRMTGMENAEEG